MEFNALRFTQNGMDGYLIKIPSSRIQNLVGIDQKTATNPDGYQRPQSAPRVKQFQKFMETEFCPVPLVANVRKNAKITFDPATSKINIPDEHDNELVKLWICEGQHRFHGYVQLYEISEIDVDIPLVVVNESRTWEISNFYIINKKQKSIATDLAEIAAMKYEEEVGNAVPGVSITDTRKEAIRITETLNTDATSPFFRRIQITGNEVKSTIKANSFHVAVEEVVKASTEIWEPTEIRANCERILVNAWKAIFEILRESTNIDTHKDYLVLKTAGIFVLNRVIAKSLDSLTNVSMDTQQDYYILFTNEHLEEIMQDDWWLAGDSESITAASYGSSQSGFKKILDKMMQKVNMAIKQIVDEKMGRIS